MHLPSYSILEYQEVYQIVIVEGVASRIPIIASKNNANMDFVNQELGTGIIINSNDNEELKKSIEKIINNPEKFTKGIPEKLKNYHLKNLEKN